MHMNMMMMHTEMVIMLKMVMMKTGLPPIGFLQSPPEYPQVPYSLITDCDDDHDDHDDEDDHDHHDDFDDEDDDDDGLQTPTPTGFPVDSSKQAALYPIVPEK